MKMGLKQIAMSELLHTHTHTQTRLGKRQRQMCPQNGNIWLAYDCRHKHIVTAKFVSLSLCLSPQNAPQ